MVYPQPDKRCFQLGIPYVVSVHDLQHRLQPEFPEVASGGLWEAREYLFGNAIRDAAVVLTDSETGRGDVLTCYRDLGAREDRVRALPFLPPTYLREDVSESERAEIRARYGLPSSYLFYPAQFWSHKNHGRLVEAVAALVGDGIDAHLVLVGSHAGRDCERVFADVCGAARRLSVRDRVLHLGYVPDDDMSGLYAMAECLVMPTFFGPTNIPILEAFTVGCPVVVSDIPGEREQVGDAGILVDPKSVESIAAGIRRLFTEPGLREELAHRGRVRIAGYTREVIQEAKDRTARPAMDQPVCLPKPEGRGSETLAK
jgi:glycosyltransferase involved in cell wall biosynthesis